MVDPGEELAGQLQVALRAARGLIIEEDRLAVRGRLGDAHVARDRRLVDLIGKCERTSPSTCCVRLVRESTIVRRMPSIFSPWFHAERTRSIVSISADSPSSA